MEEYGNSMHNTDNPVTLSGLNSKLIIREVLFYTLLIGFGLLSAQFVMSLLTINLEFYLSVAPLIRITSFFVMVGILISYLFKATSKTNFTSLVFHQIIHGLLSFYLIQELIAFISF